MKSCLFCPLCEPFLAKTGQTTTQIILPITPSLGTTQLISLSNRFANRAKTPNIRWSQTFLAPRTITLSPPNSSFRQAQAAVKRLRRRVFLVPDRLMGDQRDNLSSPAILK